MTYNNISNYINDIELHMGETVRTNCPVCNGRSTFTVSNVQGVVMWNCYKAGCNVSGSKKARITKEGFESMNKSNVGPSEFIIPDYFLPVTHNDEAYDWVFGWELEDIIDDLMYDVKEHRVVFICKDDGIPVDAAGRAIGNRIPKWKRYGKSGLPYTCGSGSVAVVVEDCVSASAIGIAPPFTGVALLGTSLTEQQKIYLTRFSTAIVALDPDAVPKTMSIAKEINTYVADVKVQLLKDDLKYKNAKDWSNLYKLIGA